MTPNRHSRALTRLPKATLWPLPRRRDGDPLVGVRGVDQDQPHHLVRIQVPEHPDDQAAVGMSGQHVRPADARPFERGVQLGGALGCIQRLFAGIAPAQARPVVSDDARHLRQRRLNPGPVGGNRSHARLQDHGGLAVGLALHQQMQAMAAHVHQVAARRKARFVALGGDGLIQRPGEGQGHHAQQDNQCNVHVQLPYSRYREVSICAVSVCRSMAML